jgi:uncharacterized protein
MFDQIIVADAGPLIALAKCERLDLLTLIFHEVHVPKTVFEEATGGRPKPETELIRSFVSQRCVLQQDRDDELFKRLLLRLDPGESQAISWAHFLGSAVLIDEKRGRMVAQAHGLPIVGVLGLFLLSKKLGHIEAVKPLLEQLAKNKYLLSDSLVTKVLQSAAEL